MNQNNRDNDSTIYIETFEGDYLESVISQVNDDTEDNTLALALEIFSPWYNGSFQVQCLPFSLLP